MATVNRPMMVTDVEAGKVEVALDAADVADAVLYRCEIEVILPGGLRVTVPNDGHFMVSVVQDLGQGG